MNQKKLARELVGAADAGEQQNPQNTTPSLADVQVQLSRYVDCVFQPDDLIEIRRLPSKRSTWHRASELPQLADQLTAESEQGEHIYIGARIHEPSAAAQRPVTLL